MKTIDELFPEDGMGRLQARMFDRQEIKDIMLEAWKQGMTDAANAVCGLKWSQEKAREHLISLRDSMKSL